MSAAQRILAKHPFSDEDVILSIANGVVDTLKMIAECQSDFEKPFETSNWTSPTDVSVYIKLDSDPYRGMIQFHFHKDIIKFLVEKITYCPIEGKDNELLDGVGEISNIFYGAAKTRLNILGFKLKMSFPIPSFTKDLPSKGNHKSVVIPFNINSYKCFVEIVVTE